MPDAPLLLVLDGNSLLHRAYHAAATGRLLGRDEQPVWAITGLVLYAARAAARLRPDAVVVGFDCAAEASVRRRDFAEYKAQRPDKPGDLSTQILAAPDVLAAAGLAAVTPDGYEADDVLASGAALARRNGWRSVLMTSDRDAFALLDSGTSVLRVRNGGFEEAVLVTPEALAEQYGVTPQQYRDYAALRGDPSDNLRGVTGFGSATAARLLATYGSVEAAWSASGDELRTLLGERAAGHFGAPTARGVVERNRTVMAMRDDLALPALDEMRLPIDRTRMRTALLAHGIRLGPSLWALLGGLPPADEAPAVPQQWVWTRRSKPRREPMPGQLALF